MATSKKDPEFYKNYSKEEQIEFANILRLIHAPQPNVALAKELVSAFRDDNKKIAQFKAFKGEFEAALHTAAHNISKHEKAQENLRNRGSEVDQHKKEIVHSKIKQVSKEVDNRGVKREPTPGHPPSKRHKQK